jgi:hypothetical protein
MLYMEVSGQSQAPVTLPPGERPGAYCIGGCVGHGACLDVLEKEKHTCQESNLRSSSSSVTPFSSVVILMQLLRTCLVRTATAAGRAFVWLWVGCGLVCILTYCMEQSPS